MTLQVWLTFVAAAWLICLSPGPGVLSSVTAGLRYGFARALWNIAGLQLGALLVLLVVGVGLGALLAASRFAFTAIKLCGALYLIYLGVQQWRSKAAPIRAPDGGAIANVGRRGALFLRGLLVNVTNPKGILFTLSVLPQFIDPKAAQLPQYLIIAVTTFFIDVCAMTGYTALGVKALQLMQNPQAIRWINRGFGTFFIVAGLALAMFKRAV
jgi:homoserine/homoserine lactone efflux protein